MRTHYKYFIWLADGTVRYENRHIANLPLFKMFCLKNDINFYELKKVVVG